MGTERTQQTAIRRALNGVDRATFGMTGAIAQSLDRATQGRVSAAGHSALYRLRVLGLRARVAARTRNVRLLSAPKARDFGIAEEVGQMLAPAHHHSGRPRILFASEMRPSIAGNLLSIRDRIAERGLDADYDIRYSFRTLDTVTPESTATLAGEFAAADIILVDDYFPLLNKVRLREDQKLIQVWHAGSGFKSVGYSRFGNYGSPRLTDTHRKYTFAICGSEHLVPVYAEVFGIPNESVIPTGLPRIDFFLDPIRSASAITEFAAEYPQFEGKKKILFAPTFRGVGARTAFYDYDRLDFERIYRLCGDDYVFLIRMHHFIADAPPIPEEFSDRIFDLSHYPDGNDLLHSIDLLITDYSSILYEFSLLDRPMVFFAYDRDLYAATRGFHRDYDEMAPGRVCLTFDELVRAIEERDYEQWKVARFREDNFDHIDTSSADRFIDQLILGDPRESAEAHAAAEQVRRRTLRAQRLAAEQTFADNPEHAGARAVIERRAEEDRLARQSAEPAQERSDDEERA